jgi:hypothetical protein
MTDDDHGREFDRLYAEAPVEGRARRPAGTAGEFIARLFGPVSEAPVYLASLANGEDKASEPGERHVITREIADIEDFVARLDRPRRGLFFCVATVAADAKRRAKNTIAEIIPPFCPHAGAARHAWPGWALLEARFRASGLPMHFPAVGQRRQSPCKSLILRMAAYAGHQLPELVCDAGSPTFGEDGVGRNSTSRQALLPAWRGIRTGLGLPGFVWIEGHPSRSGAAPWRPYGRKNSRRRLALPGRPQCRHGPSRGPSHFAPRWPRPSPRVRGTSPPAWCTQRRGPARQRTAQ